MLQYNYITELFVFIDDFFKFLEKTEFADKLKEWNPNKRGRKKQLSISQVNNMKKLMTKKQHNILKKREIIETVWDILKDR